MEEEGIRVVIFPRFFRWDPLLVFRIQRFLRRNKIHILHTYLFTANTWGRIGGILASTPLLVASERNAIPWKGGLHLFLDFILSFPTHRIVACSRAVKDMVVRRTGIREDKIRVIYNGVDTSYFVPGDKRKARKRLSLPQDAYIVGSVGRLHWCKGYVYLIRAIRKVSCRRDVLLLLVGEGEERRRLEEEVEKLGMQGRVIFAGEVGDVRDYLWSMDVAVFPSIYEGFGISILEALSSGVPVVASSTGGIPEIIRGDYGILVPPRDVERLSRVITGLLENEGRRERMRAEGRRYVEKNFSIEKTVEEWVSLYREREGI